VWRVGFASSPPCASVSRGCCGDLLPHTDLHPPFKVGRLDVRPPVQERPSLRANTMATAKVIPARQVKPTRSRKGMGGVKASFAGLMSVRDVNNPLHKKIIDFVDGRPVTVVMTAFTLYALFGDDFRLAVAPPSTDDIFFSFSLVALVLFIVELVLNSIAKADYLLRFYFWLDLVATLSLVPDIGWLWDPIVGTGSDDADASSTALQAGRASRAGTKAGRIVRIVRLVRLIRIVKLYVLSVCAWRMRGHVVQSWMHGVLLWLWCAPGTST